MNGQQDVTRYTDTNSFSICFLKFHLIFQIEAQVNLLLIVLFAPKFGNRIALISFVKMCYGYGSVSSTFNVLVRIIYITEQKANLQKKLHILSADGLYFHSSSFLPQETYFSFCHNSTFQKCIYSFSHNYISYLKS